MRALFVLILLAACSPAVESVSTYSTTIECGWDHDLGRYQDHIIYRDQRGTAVGQSVGAGECTPSGGPPRIPTGRAS